MWAEKYGQKVTETPYTISKKLVFEFVKIPANCPFIANLSVQM